ncbi:hypothetical protein AVEN_71977-1 [Araneus ventricosus]|uniref:Uncharacterized protein n=1 Tax=Araneus ventricosus TaxID=182803 RepID=A0A4Y2MIW1_ARAVE|nr:hypothetical protein AVEN_37665-1 [Araneus ventricosus]GBN27109.1 hypothetical protein AVEN_71977-1 [Araneus ventricosus]
MDDLFQFIIDSPSSSSTLTPTTNDLIDSWFQQVTFDENATQDPKTTTNDPLIARFQKISFFSPIEHFTSKPSPSRKKRKGSLFSQALATRCKPPEFFRQADILRQQIISSHLNRQAENYRAVYKAHPFSTGAF